MWGFRMRANAILIVIAAATACLPFEPTSPSASADAGGATCPDAGAGVATLCEIQQTIFTPICAKSGCHDATTASMQLVLTEGQSFAKTVNVASVEQPSTSRVAPGNPSASYLYTKIAPGVPPVGSRMPLNGPYLSQSQLELISAWITNGANNL